MLITMHILTTDFPSLSCLYSNLKTGMMGVSPLSPPHSPSTSLRTEDPHPLTETVFVSDCLTVDSLENIDRAEMNRYLWPDQQAMYSQQHQGTSSPNGSPHPLSITSSSSHNLASSSPHTLSSAHSPLVYPPPPVQPIPCSRVIGHPTSLYTGPTYCSVASPVVASGSPETGETSNSSTSPPPTVDLVELQPPRRDEPLPSLSSHKGVNPFLANNLCYSQPYTYNYPYSYAAAMWH